MEKVIGQSQEPTEQPSFHLPGRAPLLHSPCRAEEKRKVGRGVCELRSQAYLDLNTRDAPHSVTFSTFSVPQCFHPCSGYINAFLLRCLSESPSTKLTLE